MARAKRTDRAEARRRYRAELAETEGAEVGVEPLPDGTASSAASRSKDPKFASPSGRIGMGAAFRQSIHPVNLRADLAALPWLLTRTKAFLIPAALILATAVAVVVVGRANIFTNFATTYFLEAPAIGSVFIAGFLAPRASWLLGLIVGLLAAIVYTILLLAVPLMLYPPSVFGAMAPGTSEQLIRSAFILSPVMGALFAASAAWYRRFLQLSNPNRGRRAEAKRSGNDGRSRTSGSSKAKPSGARR